MATCLKPNWKRIALGVAIILPAVGIADLGFFQLRHQALICANGGRWCADVDEELAGTCWSFTMEMQLVRGRRD